MITLDVEKLRRLWFSDMVSDDIAKELGLTRHQLYDAKVAFKLPNRLVPYNAKAQLRLGDPTPEEIAERAAAIRAGWPPGEEENRLVGRRATRRVEIKNYLFDGRDCSFAVG